MKVSSITLAAIALALALTLGAAGAPGRAGALDPTFGTGGKALTDFGGDDYGTAVAIQKDGKLVVAGSSDVRGSDDFAIARYRERGVLDRSFGTGGKVLTDFGDGCIDRAAAVAIQSDGKIVVAGFSHAKGSDDFALARYTRSGALDPSFGMGGTVLTGFDSSSVDRATAMAIQPNGKIVVAGSSRGNGNWDVALARYTKSGALDRSFGTSGKVRTDFGGGRHDRATAMTIQPNGKIVVAGKRGIGLDAGFELARFTKHGELDTLFGTGGKVVTRFGSVDAGAYAVKIQQDGKLIVAGWGFRYARPKEFFEIARYTRRGTLDPSFGTGGKVLTAFGVSRYLYGYAAALQKNGEIIVAGATTTRHRVDVFALARYTTRGILDRHFGLGGRVLTAFNFTGSRQINALTIQPNRRIVAVGSSQDYNNDFALVRYLP
jgi:uncharacterized delta-60 repeat protein